MSDFSRNINQHVCVIKTGSKEISETVAAFLNSNIGEKLASRRSTGGTRPALDYPALLSIPILYNNEILKITEDIVELKKHNNVEIEKLFTSVDTYLLKELSIYLPSLPENTLKNRIFTTTIKEISESRFDPFYNHQIYSHIVKEIKKSKFDTFKFKEIFYSVRGVTFSAPDIVEDGLHVLRANNIDLKTNELLFTNIMNVSDKIEFNENQKLLQNDILMSAASGSKEHVGKVAFIERDMDYYFGGFMMVLRVIDPKNNSKYLFEYLQSRIFRTYLFRLLGGTNINNLNFDMMKNLLIPIPDTDKQIEIADYITAIRKQAKQLKDKTKEALDKASREIESILLG